MHAIALQIVGAIFGALLVAGLVPGVSVGMGDGAPGCFDDTVIGKGLTHSQLFGWEVVMTFTLISVVYACGVAKPGHGSFTPLVVGLSLVACAGTGGWLTVLLEGYCRVVNKIGEVDRLCWLLAASSYSIRQGGVREGA
jgi:glycerol uptake facilitator-like aquaporin